jgi:hypothetical protein
MCHGLAEAFPEEQRPHLKVILNFSFCHENGADFLKTYLTKSNLDS